MRYSSDLVNWDGELDPEVVADSGELTTREFDLTEISAGKALFFRVEQTD